MHKHSLFAKSRYDAAEVAVNKSTGISVSTRQGEVKNVEFNSDGALRITVYHNQRKGSACSTDLSPEAIERTVQPAVDIARYTSEDACAGPAEKSLFAFKAQDLQRFQASTLTPEDAIKLASHAEMAALDANSRIVNTEGGSFNGNYGVRVFGNSHDMLQSYFSSRYSMSSCIIAEQNREMKRDYAYTIELSLDVLRNHLRRLGKSVLVVH